MRGLAHFPPAFVFLLSLPLAAAAAAVWGTSSGGHLFQSLFLFSCFLAPPPTPPPRAVSRDPTLFFFLSSSVSPLHTPGRESCVCGCGWVGACVRRLGSFLRAGVTIVLRFLVAPCFPVSSFFLSLLPKCAQLVCVSECLCAHWRSLTPRMRETPNRRQAETATVHSAVSCRLPSNAHVPTHPQQMAPSPSSMNNRTQPRGSHFFLFFFPFPFSSPLPSHLRSLTVAVRLEAGFFYLPGCIYTCTLFLSLFTGASKVAP